MGSYFFDPNDHAAGTQLAADLGWSIPHGETFDIEDDHDNNGRGHLVYHNDSQITTSTDNYVALWPDPDSSNYPVEAVVLVHGVTGAHHSSGATVGTLDHQDAYSARISSDLSSVEIIDHEGSTTGQTVLASGAVDSTISDLETERIWIRVRADGAGLLEARAWLEGDAEPSTWQASVDVGTYYGNEVGYRSNTANNDHYFWELGVGTAGDSAPKTAEIVAAVGQAAEADAALSVSASKTASVGLAESLEEALPVRAIKVGSLGQVGSAETALATGAIKFATVGLATEADSTLPISTTKILSVGLASEADAARPVGALRVAAVGLAESHEEARGVRAQAIAPVGRAESAETALGVSATKYATVGQVNEDDVALGVTAVTPSTIAPVGLAGSSEVALPVRSAKIGRLGQAIENDLVKTIDPNKLKESTPERRRIEPKSEARELATRRDRNIPITEDKRTV